MIKDLVLQQVAARRRRSRRPPRLRTGEPSGTGTVYFLCPDFSAPAGGNRTIYRFVDFLVEAGIPAAVLHFKRGFTMTWFEHSTPVVYAPDVELSASDVLVVPETFGPCLQDLPREPCLVVFNQNCYQTFELVPAGQSPYASVDRLLTVSDDNSEYLRFAFPDIPVAVVPPGIPADLFRPGDADLPRRIAYMPRRRGDDAEQVFAMLGGRLRGWETVPIDGCSQKDAAELLRTCPIFLSLSQREGFGLPPAEAMACGAYVVGFAGLAGREFMLPRFSRRVEEDNVRDLAFALADVMSWYETDPGEVRATGLLASHHIHTTYTLDRERDGVLGFFAPLLAEAALTTGR